MDSRYVSTKPPAWVWLAMLTIVSLFIAFLVHLSKIPFQAEPSIPRHAPTAQSSQYQVLTNTNNRPVGIAEKKYPETRLKKQTATQYSFYTQLPQAEVLPSIRPKVPETKSTNPSLSRPTKNDPMIKDSTLKGVTQTPYYVVQSGSFRKEKEAEKRKVDLILHGLSPSINTIENAKGQKWHRVIIGPFTDISVAKRVEKQVKSINISANTYRLNE